MPRYRGAPHAPPAASLDEILAYVDQCERNELVELLKARAVQDDALRAELTLRIAARAGSGVIDHDLAKRAIEQGIDVHEFVPWQAMSSWENRAMGVVEHLERLFSQGHLDGLLALVEHALHRVEGAAENVDDSGGEITMLLEPLQALHRKVVAASGGDVEALVQRLYRWGKHSPLGLFYDAIDQYADILGPDGLAAYCAIVEADFAELPQLVATDADRSFEGPRSFITSQMEAIAARTGSAADLIDVLRRDLSSSHQYLRIAQEYAKAGDPKKAVDWAERGLASFREGDPRLRTLLGELKLATGDPAAAAELAWQNFKQRPTIETYVELQRFATVAKRLDHFRLRAHDHVRTAMHGPGEGNARALLIELLLHDGEAEAALAEAKAGPCADQGWYLLAHHFEESQPLEAALIYVGLLDSILAPAKKQAYRRAAHQLGVIRSLLKKAGHEQRFDGVVATVRQRHGLKRNLMGMLDAAGW